MTYEDWIKCLDSLFSKRYGLHHDDVEDYLWHDAFEDGLSPVEVFEDWIIQND